MNRTLPLTLAATAAILVACSSGGSDTMASMLRDAGETIDDMLQDAASAVDGSGPGDAKAQPAPEVMEADCKREYTQTVTGASGVGNVFRYHLFTSFVDIARVRSAWACEPVSAQTCVAGFECTGDRLPPVQCQSVSAQLTDQGLVVPCGSAALQAGAVTDDRRYRRARVLLSP